MKLTWKLALNGGIDNKDDGEKHDDEVEEEEDNDDT